MNHIWTDEERTVLVVELRLLGAPPSVLRWYESRTHDPNWPWDLQTLREDVFNNPEKMQGVLGWGHRNKDWYPPPPSQTG